MKKIYYLIRNFIMHMRWCYFRLMGMDAIVLPGIRIGDHSVVGAGSVVTKDVPPHTIVAGNPAKIIKEGINTKKWGQLIKE